MLKKNFFYHSALFNSEVKSFLLKDKNTTFKRSPISQFFLSKFEFGFNFFVSTKTLTSEYVFLYWYFDLVIYFNIGRSHTFLSCLTFMKYFSLNFFFETSKKQPSEEALLNYSSSFLPPQPCAGRFSLPTSWRSWRKPSTKLTTRTFTPERCCPWRPSCPRTGYRCVCVSVCVAAWQWKCDIMRMFSRAVSTLST